MYMHQIPEENVITVNHKHIPIKILKREREKETHPAEEIHKS